MERLPQRAKRVIFEVVSKEKLVSFFHSFITDIGVLLIWVGWWTFIDLYIIPTSFIREVVYTFVGYFGLCITLTLPTQALIIEYEEVENFGSPKKPPSFLKRAVRICLVYVACVVSILSVITLQAGVYNLLALYMFPANFHPISGVIIMVLSFVAMAVTGCLHSSAGYSVFPLQRHSKQIKILWVHAFFAQLAISINWEACWELIDTYLWHYSIPRDIVYIFVGIGLFVATNTWNGKAFANYVGSGDDYKDMTTQTYMLLSWKSARFWWQQLRSAGSMWAVSFFWCGLWDILAGDYILVDSAPKELTFAVVGVLICSLEGSLRYEALFPFAWSYSEPPEQRATMLQSFSLEDDTSSGSDDETSFSQTNGTVPHSINNTPSLVPNFQPLASWQGALNENESYEAVINIDELNSVEDAVLEDEEDVLQDPS